jgi:hypothetical protein
MDRPLLGGRKTRVGDSIPKEGSPSLEKPLERKVLESLFPSQAGTESFFFCPSVFRLARSPVRRGGTRLGVDVVAGEATQSGRFTFTPFLASLVLLLASLIRITHPGKFANLDKALVRRTKSCPKA